MRSPGFAPRWAAACGAVLAFLGIVLPGMAQADPFKLIVTETDIPLVPNSVEELALTLGYYKRAGVDVALVRVQQTPSAVAALRAGEGDMANITTDTALQLIGRNQMKLVGVISPDKALPLMIVAKAALTTPQSLEGKTFGVARLGSADYTLSRIVLAKLGADPDKLQYLAVGQPPVRAQALIAGRIDATAISLGIWTSMPNKAGLSVMADHNAFYERAPLLSKLNVVTDAVAKAKATQIEAVVRAIIFASRDFAQHPEDWVKAMTMARPDVRPSDLEALAQSYRESWSVNGGLNLAAINFTTEITYKGPDFKDVRLVAPAEWINTRFIDTVLKQIGTVQGNDETGR